MSVVVAILKERIPLMNRMFKGAIAGLLLVLASASPAHASWMAFWDYLDNLSGPGPFLGFGADIPLICIDNKELRTECFNVLRTQDRHIELGPDFSYLRGLLNDKIVYPGSPTDDQRRVNVLTYGVHAKTWLNDRTKTVHAGVMVRFTAVRFKGDLMPRIDHSLTDAMFSVGPIFQFPTGVNRFKLEVTPLLQLGLGPFSVEDFGALSPPLNSDAAKLGIHIGIAY